MPASRLACVPILRVFARLVLSLPLWGVSFPVHAAITTWEAESLLSGPTIETAAVEGASPAENPRVVVFRREPFSLAFQSEQTMPEGQYWAKARVRPLSSGDGPARVRISMTGEGERHVWLGADEFVWIKTLGSLRTRTRPILNIESLEGQPIAIDQIAFEFLDQSPPLLPAVGGASGAPSVSVLFTPGDAARQAAESLKSRLDAMGVPAEGPIEADRAAQDTEGMAVVLVCDDWNEPAVHRRLPTWPVQPGAADRGWVCKPAGLFGTGPALGVRAGNGDVPDDALAWVSGRAAQLPAAPVGSGPAPQAALAARDLEGLTAGLSAPDETQARLAADLFLQWLDSPESLGRLPEADASRFAAALGAWLYQAPRRVLQDSDRMAFGALFDQWASQDARVLSNGGVITPRAVNAALALYFADQGFGWSAVSADHQGLYQKAQDVLRRAPAEAMAETTRGRLQLARDLAAYSAIRGDAEPAAAREWERRVADLALGPDRLSAFGDEKPYFPPAELQRLPLSQEFGRERSAAGGMAPVRTLAPPAAARAWINATLTGAFDKLIFAGDAGRFALLDGLTAPDGYADAGALLRLGDEKSLWVGGPGPGAPDAKHQNLPTVLLNGRRIAFDAAADCRITLTGARSALAVIELAGEGGARWRRALYLISSPDAFIVFDEIRPGAAGTLEAANRWRLLGRGEATGPGAFQSTQGGGTLRGWALDAGDSTLTPAGSGAVAAWDGFLGADEQVHLLRQRWLGSVRAADTVAFRTVFSTDTGGLAAQGLKGTAARFGPAAAFLGAAQDPALHFDGDAALIGPEEILLAGVRRVECGQPRESWIETDGAVAFDLAILKSSGVIEAAIRRAATLRIRLPESARPAGEGVQRAGEFWEVRLPAGRHRLQLGDAAGLGPLFDALARSVAGMPQGAAGATPSPAPAVAGPALAGIEASLPFEAGVADLNLIDGAAGKAAVYSLNDGRIGWIASEGDARELGRLDSPAARIRAVDMNFDGEPEWVAVCRDGSLRALNAEGEEEGRIGLLHPGTAPEGDPHLDVVAIDGAGVPVLAAGAGDGRLTMLDHLGQAISSYNFGAPIARLKFSEMNTDGRPAALAALDDGRRAALRFGRDFEVAPVWLSDARAEITAAAMIDANSDGRAEAVFGDADGWIEAFALGEGGAASPIWRARVGEEAIRDIAPGYDRSTPIGVASANGLAAGLGADGSVVWFAYLDGPATALATQGGGRWLAATESGSLFGIEGAPGAPARIHESIALGGLAEAIRPLAATGGKSRWLIHGPALAVMAGE